MREDAEERVLPIEKLDRLEKANFRKYILDNPFYAEEVFGYVPTEQELDEYIEHNKELFYADDPYKQKKRSLW